MQNMLHMEKLATSLSMQQVWSRCSQGLRKCCLANMLGQKQLTDAQVIDNIIAAAFGNASAGPTAAKAFQHLAAGEALRV